MRISTLVATAVSVAAASVTGGLASGPSVRSEWYAQLRKPAYQPPRQVFPIIWPVLYADIAVVSASAIDQARATGKPQARSYQAALAVNLVLNGGWSWVFFRLHRLGMAAALAAALTVSSGDVTRRAIAVGSARAAPSALYPLWCAFATALSTHIWLLNRPGGLRRP